MKLPKSLPVPFWPSRPIVVSYLIGIFTLVAVVLSSAIYSVRAHAAESQNGQAHIVLVPSVSQASAGQTITFQVFEDSGREPVNAVQANLSYPKDSLRFIALDQKLSVFDLAVEGQDQNGTLKIAKGVSKPVTGKNLVATIKFSALKPVTNPSLSVAPDSAVIRASDTKNILAGSTLQAGTAQKAQAATPPVRQAETADKPSLWQRFINFLARLFGLRK